jgi:HlyD family secretion protein
VRKNGEAKLRVVKTGIQDDTNIQITSGLEEGEEVITGPYSLVTKTLNAGDKVEVKSETKEKE